MKIDYLIYKNITEDYTIEKVDFRTNLSLLVGASGAGKTQILRAIDQLCKFACGRNLDNTCAFEAELGFMDKDGNRYRWQLKTALTDERVGMEVNGLKVLCESLTSDSDISIFDRNEDSVMMAGYDQIPMPKESESIISQYRNSELLMMIYLGLRSVELVDLEEDLARLTSANFFLDSTKKQKLDKELAEYFSMDTIFSPFDRFGIMKIIELPKYDEVYSHALERFQDIFPTVQDIDYVQNEMNQYGIAIKTNDHWVMQKNISSGMLKTLWHILNILTTPTGAVIMLDEFENGLGINCIDVVSNMILEERPDIQIILTSHHPYIINCIPMQNWLITRRVGKRVQISSADDYQLGQSKHEAYIELMNRLVQDEMQIDEG